MANLKLTEEEIQRRVDHIKEIIARSPDLTVNHFLKHFSYGPTVTTLAKKQGVKFASKKPSQHYRDKAKALFSKK